MEILIPFAHALAPQATETLRTLLVQDQLPHLKALMASSPDLDWDRGDELSLSPPHERALAQALGWPVVDGELPWAAWSGQQAGLLSAEDLAAPQAWGWLSLSHWHLGTEQVGMHDPADLQLSEAESRQLLATVQPLLEEDGFALRWCSPTQSLIGHPSLAGLPCASLDRVVGRNVDLWLQAGPRTRAIRRLQNELQMAWHEHPVNQAREARGLLSVNSVWISGCGVAAPTPAQPAPRVEDGLRIPALREDWPAWALAWRHLDAEVLRPMVQGVARGQAARLTLCGERAACRLRPTRQPWWRAWRRPGPQALLATLSAL